MAKVTGRVSIKKDGQQLLNRSGWTFNPGGVRRNTQVGDSGVHGHSEETVAPSVSGNVSHTKALDLVELGKDEDVTILFETDTGQSYVLRNAWLVDPPELTAGDGEVSLTYEGMAAERL